MTTDLEEAPRWLLAIGPVVVLGSVAGLLYLTSPFGSTESLSSAGTAEILWTITAVGFFAGIVPVVVGMLWFPFVQSLHNRRVHALLTLSAGVLAVVAVEMVAELRHYGGEVDGAVGAGPVSGLDGTAVAVVLATVGVVATAFAMKWVSDWRRARLFERGDHGLLVAYLIAIGLGFHSVGEGLAIGASFTTGAYALVTLLVVGFVLHNVTEGLTIVSAVARDGTRPPLRHFAALGVLAGGPLIVGGWLGTLAYSPMLAVLFLAIGIGAIVEVIWEVGQLIRMDAEAIVTRLNGAGFAAGVGMMIVLEDVVVNGLLL